MNEKPFEGLWKERPGRHFLDDHHPVARKNEIVSAIFSPNARGKSPSYLVVIAKGGHPVRFVFQSRMSQRPATDVQHAECSWATPGSQVTGEQQKKILRAVEKVFDPLADRFPNHALAIKKAIEKFGKV